jgi:hypothetical protein
MSGRKLKARSYEFLGVDQKVWLAQETGGFGDIATGGLVPPEAGAVDFVSCDIKFDIPREDSPSRSGRSVVARLSGKKTVEVKVESHIIPGTPLTNGNPTLPPMHALILSAFGDVDLSNPAEIKYKLSRFNGNSARILEEATHYSRLAVGVIADKLSFSLPGDGKAMMSMEGFAQDAYIAGESNLVQALTGVAQFASRVIADLTYTADVAGRDGNTISIAYTAGATQGAEVVTVVGNTISVQIESGVSDADDVKAAIDGFPAAAALVNVTVTGVNANAQVVTAATFLTGGLGTNDIKVTLDHGFRYEVGSYIDVIDGTDGNTLIVGQKKVVAVYAAPNKDIITVDGAALPAAAIGSFIIGHAPDDYQPITAEYALLGLKGTFNVAGYPISDCELISAEIGLSNNYTKKDFLYGTDKICGFIPDKRREVSVKLEVLLNKDTLSFYMRNKQFVAEDVTITLEPQRIPGPAFTTSVGRTWEFRMPKVEFNIPPIENPADSYVTLSLEGIALAPSSNNLDEEFVLTIK